jgi:hypothetical protein
MIEQTLVEDRMVDDAALWFLVATCIAFIWGGCIMTAKRPSRLEF